MPRLLLLACLAFGQDFPPACLDGLRGARGADCRDWRRGAQGTSRDPVPVLRELYRRLAAASGLAPRPPLLLDLSVQRVEAVCRDGGASLAQGPFEVFAVSCPDGRRYVAAGGALLDLAGDCAEGRVRVDGDQVAAFILAHELAHHVLDHPRLAEEAIAAECPGCTEFPGCGCPEDGLARALALLRSHELAADREGRSLMTLAGLDARAARCGALRLRELERGDYELFGPRDDTHPDGGTRSDELGLSQP